MNGEIEEKKDQWSEWLLKRRDGNDPESKKNHDTGLSFIRDEVLEHAEICEGDVVLDIGAGTGLISLEALEKVGEHGKVIFSDISHDCLDHCRSLIEGSGREDRCEFIVNPAEGLSEIPDASVDVVTCRSVLIYITLKQQAFNEFYRVLKPKGRLSIFEPINRFGFNASPTLFRGYDVSPILEIAQKVREALQQFQPVEGSPMLDFNEHDLAMFATTAGFAEVHLAYNAYVIPGVTGSWERFYTSAPNPLALTVEEAVERSLTESEQEMFVNFMRTTVETVPSTVRSAQAFLWATRDFALDTTSLPHA